MPRKSVFLKSNNIFRISGVDIAVAASHPATLRSRGDGKPRTRDITKLWMLIPIYIKMLPQPHQAHA